jgi:hypothetical protein
MLNTMKRVVSSLPTTSGFSDAKKSSSPSGGRRPEILATEVFEELDLEKIKFFNYGMEPLFRISIPHRIRNRELLKRLLGFGIEEYLIPGPPGPSPALKVPKDAPLAFVYLCYCIAKHNVGIATSVSRLFERYEFLTGVFDQKVKVRSKMEGLPSWFPTPPRPKVEVDDNLFGQFAELSMEIESLPKPVTLDVVKGISWSLGSPEDYDDTPLVKVGGIKVHPRKLQNLLFGPLKEMAIAVAQNFGVSLPIIPHFVVKRQGTMWVRDINRALDRCQFVYHKKTRSLKKDLLILEEFAERLYNRKDK